MSACIPIFHKKIEPLTNISEKAYKMAGKRKKSSLEKVLLSSVSWGAEHEVAFKELQETLKTAV